MHITTSNDVPSWNVSFGGEMSEARSFTLSMDKIVWDPNYNQKASLLGGCLSPQHNNDLTASCVDKKPGHGAGQYHNQLHASLQAFRLRKWRPLSPDTIKQSTVTRCRPISGGRRPSTPGPILAPHPPNERPEKEKVETSPTNFIDTIPYPRRPDTPRVTQGNYDTLSPRILSHLVNDPRPSTPNSTYGDIIRVNRKSRKNRLQKKTEEEIFNESSSAYSGSDDDDDDGRWDSDDEDDGNMPETGRYYGSNFVPSGKAGQQQLRPEQLDHFYTPSHKRDMTRFEFDAEKTMIPSYDFACPIPTPFNKINFRLHARENTNWRFTSAEPENPSLSVVMDRLVELEKMQIETEEWEEKRMKSCKKRPPSRDSGNGSTAIYRIRDKRCCSSCLQPCCVGDCPNKRPPGHPVCCEMCHQPFCTGTCLDNRYEQRMRQPRDTQEKILPSRQPLPKNCRTCQRKHTAKLINANHVVLGRPKSAFSTFSRGRNSTRPKDLRPKSALNVASIISEKIEQLGLDPVQSTPSPKTSRPSSRNGLIPGKTYFSNLSHSLTDLTSKRRCKSAKLKRPRSVKGKRKEVQ